MLLEEDSLLYCAYAIAIFDMLCAVLFAALCLTLILNHLSWLTIFCVCFGFFWLTLILLLISGIYRRDSDLVWYWLCFSCLGILMEFLLIVYAFLSESHFQTGIVQNGYILCLGLIVESIFAYIIYQFYLVVAQCTVSSRPQTTPDCDCSSKHSLITVNSTPRSANMDKRRSSPKNSRPYKCNVLQSSAPTSPYTCGPRSSRLTFHRISEQL